jgi:transglutaminase-like putative cysteine protease
MSTPGPLTGTRGLLGSLLVACAVIAGLLSLRPLVQPGPWLAMAVTAVLAMTLVTAVARLASRTAWVPTAWGAVVGATGIAWLYADPRGPALPLPTLETARSLRRVAESGATSIADGYLPLAPDRGVEVLLVAGAVVVVLAVDLLALGLSRAGLAGLPLVGLWSVSVVFERPPSLPLLLVGGTSFLLLLTVTRPARYRDRSDAVRAGAAAAGAAAAVTAVSLAVGPAAAALPGWGSVRLPTTWGEGAGSGPVELSLDLDMRSSLGSRSDRPVLTYSLTGRSPGPLRLYTLTEFDGREWQREVGSRVLVPVEGQLWPDTAPPAGEGESSVMEVWVGDLDQDHLPLPIEPRVVRLPRSAPWTYDGDRDEVQSRTASTLGLRYEVEVSHRDLSEESLRADRPAPTEPGSPYLEVPETEFAEAVRALADEVTAGADSAYDQALALQTYLRDASTFRYDTRVPSAETSDAVWDFLTERRGYCVQYATAMTIMARHLGLPARMAVGFLPGRAGSIDRNEYVVTARLAHTWPEIHFAEAGWVRFEPTPAAQTGAPPAYADPLSPDDAVPTPDLPGAEQSQPPTPAPTAAPRPQGGVSGDVALGTARVPVRAVLAVAAVLVVTTVVVALRGRRRAPEPEPRGPEASWERLRARLLDRGVGWSDALTPRRAALVVLEALGERATEDSRAALRHLVAAVENERYAPVARPWDGDQLDLWVAAVLAPLDESRDRVDA